MQGLGGDHNGTLLLRSMEGGDTDLSLGRSKDKNVLALCCLVQLLGLLLQTSLQGSCPLRELLEWQLSLPG